MTNKEKSKSVAVGGMFAAIVIVLQLLSYVIKIGTFNLSLVLVPIVLAASLYGKKVGAVLGFIFGGVTFVAGLTGLDAGCNMMINASLPLTVIVAFGKATAAGFCAGLAAEKTKKFGITVSTLLAALTAPIVNSGLFLLMMWLFFKNLLIEWSGGGELLYYIFFGLIGINFVIELGINLIFSSALANIISKVKRI